MNVEKVCLFTLLSAVIKKHTAFVELLLITLMKVTSMKTLVHVLNSHTHALTHDTTPTFL